MSMCRRGKTNRISILLLTIFILEISIELVETANEIIVETPFYLRARIHDARTATVLFEIARENNQRKCEMYKFIIHRNREIPYSMPEQNLTFWRNSLELKHLDVGEYRICAIICSEYLKQHYKFHDMFLPKKNYSVPIEACVNIHAYRSHFLILTLYILVFIILAFSQIIFTLRKRKIRAGIQTALLEVENTLQKWRTTQTTTDPNDQPHTYSILQSLVTLPAAPIEHVMLPSFRSPMEGHRPSHPIVFHLDTLHE